MQILLTSCCPDPEKCYVCLTFLLSLITDFGQLHSICCVQVTSFPVRFEHYKLFGTVVEEPPVRAMHSYGVFPSSHFLGHVKIYSKYKTAQNSSVLMVIYKEMLVRKRSPHVDMRSHMALIVSPYSLVRISGVWCWSLNRVAEAAYIMTDLIDGGCDLTFEIILLLLILLSNENPSPCFD